MWAVMALQSWECCAPYLLPTLTRTTTGIRSAPADMACHLESWLKISSPARPRKSQYISSTSARPPSMAQPTAVPTMAPSEMGALNRRW